MIIERIYIDAFGKFQNFDLDFTQNFNVIYGNNEDGKSTIMAFIRMMFYGDSSRKRTLRDKPRDLHRPWASEKMGGSLFFSLGGVRYQLDRRFGRSNATDKIQVTNLANGKVYPLPRKENPGDHFFDMGLEAFEKSVFIEQSGSLITDAGKDDELTGRLLNLVTTADENISYKAVQEHLDTAEYMLKGRRKGGLITASLERLEKLQQEKQEAESDERSKQLALEEIQLMKTKKAKLELENRRLRSKQDLIALSEDVASQQNKIRLRTELEQVEDARIKHLAVLKREDTVLDAIFVSDAEAKLLALKNHENQLQELRITHKLAKDDLEKLRNQPILEIPDGTVDQLEQWEKDLTASREQVRSAEKATGELEALSIMEEEHEKLLDEMKTKKKLLCEKEERGGQLSEELAGILAKKQAKDKTIKQALSKLEEISIKTQEAEKARNQAEQAVISLEDKYQFKLEILRDQVKQSQQAQIIEETRSSTREFKKPLLAAAISLFALGIALGIVFTPYFYLLVMLSVISFVFSIKTIPAQTIKRQVVDKEAQKKAEQALEDEEALYVSQHAQLKGEEDEMQAVFSDLLEQKNAQIKRKKEMEDQLNKLEQELITADKAHDANTIMVAASRAAYDGLKKQEKKQSETIANKRAFVSTLLNVFADTSDDALEFKTPLELASFTRKLEEFKKSLDETSQKITAKLDTFSLDASEDLYDLEKTWTLYKQKLEHKQEELKKSEARISCLEKQIKQEETALITFVSNYKPISSRETLVSHLEELKAVLKEIDDFGVEIKAYRSNLGDGENRTLEELKGNLNNLNAQMLVEINKLQEECSISVEDLASDQESELTQACSLESAQRWAKAQDVEALEARSKAVHNEISNLLSEIGSQTGRVREKYRHKRSVSTIENEISHIEALIAKQKEDLSILQITAKTMEEAFTEMQQNFGPIVNEKTAYIFKTLTNGKYDNLKVAQDFSITFEDCDDRKLREWGYLSGGTIDQAYLALRLAITELVTDDMKPLPLLLDDVFTLYDDERAYKAMEFIDSYSDLSENNRQIFLFTCHERIANWGKELGATLIGLSEIQE